MQIAKISTFYRKSESRNAMVMSDFRLEILPYCTCAMKHMQYNPYLMAELPRFL